MMTMTIPMVMMMIMMGLKKDEDDTEQAGLKQREIWYLRAKL